MVLEGSEYGSQLHQGLALLRVASRILLVDLRVCLCVFYPAKSSSPPPPILEI